MDSEPHDPNGDRFYGRAFALATTVILGYVLFQVLDPFVRPLAWAIFLAFLLYPTHRKLSKKLGSRGGMSAALLTVATFVMLIGPLTILSAAFASQVGELVQYAHGLVPDQAQGYARRLSDIPGAGRVLTFLSGRFGITTEQVQGWLIEGARQTVQGIAGFSGKLFLGALGTVADFGLTLFMLFFFIRDGGGMLRAGRDLIPMNPAQRQQLFNHLDGVTRAVVFGTGMTALIQGSLVGIAFAIVGLPSPVVFAVIAALLSLLPIGGSGLVWGPAAILLAVQERWWAAVFMIAWGAMLVSMIDNLVRPMLISGRAQVATLTVFIGVLGGVSAFGTIGLFLGPVVLALAISLIGFAVEERRRKESPST